MLNLEHKYSTDLVLTKSKTPFDVNKTDNYLKEMIPGFVANNFTLKRKPKYLTKWRCHKQYSTKIYEKLKKMKECYVRLERCDNMLAKQAKRLASVEQDRQAIDRVNNFQTLVVLERIDGGNGPVDTRYSDESEAVEPIEASCGLFREEKLSPKEPLKHAHYNRGKKKSLNESNSFIMPIPKKPFGTSSIVSTHNMDEPMIIERTIVEPMMLTFQDEIIVESNLSQDETNEMNTESCFIEQNCEETVAQDDFDLVEHNQTVSEVTSQLSNASTVDCDSDTMSFLTSSESQLSSQSSSESSQSSDSDGLSDIESLLIRMLKLYGQSAKNQSEIQLLKIELRNKIEREQNMKHDILAKMREILTRILSQKRIRGEVPLQDNTEDTDANKWCRVCNEAANVKIVQSLNIPLCSNDCFRIFW